MSHPASTTTADTAATEQRFAALAAAMRAIAIEAGILTERMRMAGVTPETKEDGSLVTPADRASEALIKAAVEGIRDAFDDILPPTTTFVGEESIEAGDTPNTTDGHFFVVDPIDATKNFVQGTPGKDLYTINIALVLDNTPVLGVIHEPVSGDLIATLDRTQSVLSRPGKPDTPLTPGVKVDSEGKPLPLYRRGAMGYADLIRGEREDIHHGKSYEWDTAAQDAILRTVGGSIRRHDDNTRLAYNKADQGFFNPAINGRMDGDQP
ncbi:MAG: inositol monophosphatase family protein [Pseudomonadota bacterium]